MEIKEGFTFWRSFYDAYLGAESIGKGTEYLVGLMEYAFNGTEPKTEDPILKAFYSSAMPSIRISTRNIRNGQRGGSSEKK